VFWATVAATAVSAQSAWVLVSPRLGVPVSPTDLYTWEAGAGVDLRLPGAGVEALGRFSYSSLLVKNNLPQVNLIEAGAGVAFPLVRSEGFAFSPTLWGGGYLAQRANAHALVNPLVGFGLWSELTVSGLKFAVEPDARFLVALQDGKPGLFLSSLGLLVSVGLSPLQSARAAHQPLLRFERPVFEPVFPILYKSYGTQPVGRVTLVNAEKQTVTDVRVSFFLPSYMDKPQAVAQFGTLEPGSQQGIPITALMRNSVLGITETDSVQSQLVVTYRLGGEALTSTLDGSVRIEGRNAIVWDDDRKAAAFVTSKDPSILKLARNTLVSLPDDTPTVPSANLRSAVALFQALEAYGLRYAVDPSGSYATMKGVSTAVDFLQFPVETLSYRTGDCDDLSTLYNAVLESVGVESAFITVPGHIYAAFALNLDPKSAASVLADPESFIVRDNRVWIPVETTALGRGFAEAWRLGAQEWAEGVKAHIEALVPVHEAWQSFEPSFISSEERSEVVSRLPDFKRVAAASKTTLGQLADQQLASLLARAGATAGPASVLDPSRQNKIGVLYARYGHPDQAERWFQAAANQNFAPALYNWGNVKTLKGDKTAAADLYQRASALAPSPVPRAEGAGRADNSSDLAIDWRENQE
jgi:hypothetical protein